MYEKGRGKQEKKVYRKPHLEKMGNLLEVTLGGVVGTNDAKGAGDTGGKS